MPADTTTNTTLRVPLDQLTIGLDFRLDEAPDALAELAASIAESGVLQPLLVRRNGHGWGVVAGRRRLAAARIAGLDTVPCHHQDLDDDQAADAALAENLHRRALSPIEEALAYARLRDSGLNGKQIAARVGKAQSHVSTLLTLLTIDQALQDAVHRRVLSVNTALDRAGRRNIGPKRGGVSTHGALNGDTATLVTHWRRRHDRVLAGIATILRDHRLDGDEVRQALHRLMTLDRQPLEPAGKRAGSG